MRVTMKKVQSNIIKNSQSFEPSILIRIDSLNFSEFDFSALKTVREIILQIDEETEDEA